MIWTPFHRRKAFSFVAVSALTLASLEVSMHRYAFAQPAAASPVESNAPPMVMGLDLTSAPVVKSVKDIPDIYEPDPKQPGKWREKSEVFSMPLGRSATENPTMGQGHEPESIWLKYPTSLNRFYIQYRSDRNKPETERTYGPYAGYPLDRMNLERVMADRLQAQYSPDDINRIRQMFKTQNSKLIGRAMLLMQAAIDCKEPSTAEIYLREIEQIAKANSATIEKLDLKAESAKLDESIAAKRKMLDELVASFPDTAYASAERPQFKLPEIPPGAWGKDVNGLRAAAVPVQKSVALKTELPFDIVLENTSDHDIRFSFRDMMQSVLPEIQDSKGKNIVVGRTFFSGWAAIQRFILKPNERLAVARVTIQPVTKREGVNPNIGCTLLVDKNLADAPATEYRIKYEVPIATGTSWSGGEDGVMRKISPAKGEWNGTLTTPLIDIKVTNDEKPADGDKPVQQ
jgi:hypothetical protein